MKDAEIPASSRHFLGGRVQLRSLTFADRSRLLRAKKLHWSFLSAGMTSAPNKSQDVWVSFKNFFWSQMQAVPQINFWKESLASQAETG